MDPVTSLAGTTGGLGTSISVDTLTAAGYTVISYDRRASGDSGGTNNLLNPDVDIQDQIAIVDWAEQHLDYLAYEDNNLVLGGVGGSFAGASQLLMWSIDPDQRFDAIVPEIAWNNLANSLNPNGVPKSYWIYAQVGLGEIRTQGGEDPFIRQAVLEGTLDSRMPESALAYLQYVSPDYFCDNPFGLHVRDTGDTSAFTLDPLLGKLSITAGGHYVVQSPPFDGRPPKVNALLIQGIRDNLFNLNEAWKNFQCLQRGGGDVRLLTYNTGHYLFSPLSLDFGAITEGQPPLDTKCGNIEAGAAILSFLNEKLRGTGDTDEVVTTGQDICLALQSGDAVQVPSLTVGGEFFAIQLPGDIQPLVVNGNPVPIVVPLTTIGEAGDVIAGIPTVNLELSLGLQELEAFCKEKDLPIPVFDAQGTCDSRVYIGLGRVPAGLSGLPELLEEQVTPVRGVGEFHLELAGVAERLKPGDQLVLLLYGDHYLYVGSESRDLLGQIVKVSGSVQLPLLGNLPNIVSVQ